MTHNVSIRMLIEGAESVASKMKTIEGAAQAMLKPTANADVLRAALTNFSASSLARNPNLIAQLTETGKKAAQAFDSGVMSQRGFLAAFINQNLGIGAGQNRPGRAGYASWWQSAIPPIIPPPIIQSASGGGGNFSGIFRALGLGGGGGLKGSIPVMAAFLALTLAIKATRIAMEQLVKAIQEGAKLFTDSARLGQSQGRLFGFRAGLESIGVSNPDQLLLYGQFGAMMRQGRSGLIGGSVSYRRGVSADVEGMMLGAMRVGNMGDIQAIQNLKKYLHQFIQETELDSQIMQTTSRQLFETSFAWKRFKTELQAAWAGFAAELSVVLIPALMAATMMLHQYNAYLLKVLHTFQKLGLIAKDMAFSGIGGGMGDQHIPANAMQRMGFVFSTGNFNINYASETARNTKETAHAVYRLVNIFSKGGVQENTLASAKAYATNP